MQHATSTPSAAAIPHIETVAIDGIESFRAGTHTDHRGQRVTITADDLARAADAYDPAVFAAPVTVGHIDLTSPALGQLRRLDVRGDLLTSDASDVPVEFAALVRAKTYSRVSMSFFRPDAPDNPVRGVWYPRHLSFLGAAQPALTSLRPVEFAGSDDSYCCFAADASDATDAAAPAQPHEPPGAPMSEPTQAPDAQSVEFAAIQSENAQLRAQLEAIQAEQAAQAAALRRQAIVDFAAEQVGALRLHPDEVEGFVAFAVALDDNQSVEFAAAAGAQLQQVTPLEWLRRFIARRGPLVPQGEQAAPDTSAPAVAFAAPPGTHLDAESARLHAEATALAREHNITFIDALNRLAAR